MIRVLVACEFSGVVRSHFRLLGADAWSCDLLPAEDNSPYHIQGDVRKILDDGWDLMVAHPPCTYLCNSGVQWLYKEDGRWERMSEAAEFFNLLFNAPIKHIAVENPIPHKYARALIGPYTQLVHPYYFGEPYKKATCLWLKNLPPLKPTSKLPSYKAISITNKYGPSPDRWKKRSRFFPSIASAMAVQWTTYILTNR